MSEKKTRALEAMLRTRVVAPASANPAKRIIQKAMTYRKSKRHRPPLPRYRRRGNDRRP